jgi:hypothetical protein
MNQIKKHSIGSLGYQFVASDYIPKGQDEYYLRNLQNRSGIQYRHLTAFEIEVLVRNRNTSDDWNNLLVSDAFTPELVKNCKFFGLVRIGKLEPFFLEFHNIKTPVGLYNSTIISCDFGDNVVVDNVNYMAHYIIGNEVILLNINELTVTDRAKFGNGIIKEGERENIRIWMEICNENGGRKVLPFNGMLAGDAWLWSRYRDKSKFQQQLIRMTENKFDKKRGYYGKIGDRTVIKHCRIIKDSWIGTDAYIKGANKIKNTTIQSTAAAPSQIGEGCELVNGIMSEGCRAFYGVKAVRFIMASHSQLKYGARLINSYLGNNATISCCEVLNSLIFPGHEQHHNNSFLCASLVMGQSNIAAGATIGSNHNSRAADGEIVAGRGFWPGLCVSLKHHSRFASFVMIAKGDYPSELDIPLPFSLISNDTAQDRLLVMPAYWVMHNMYALERNAKKALDRDQRIDRIQNLETRYLAPDTIKEVAHACEQLAFFTGNAWLLANPEMMEDVNASQIGHQLLQVKDPQVPQLTILANGYEHSKRPVVLLKVTEAYHIYQSLIEAYVAQQLIVWQQLHSITTYSDLQDSLEANPKQLYNWLNVGGQLIEASAVDMLIKSIEKGKIKQWAEVHQFYQDQAVRYDEQQALFAIGLYQDVFGIDVLASKSAYLQLLKKYHRWLIQQQERVESSRAKDYVNPFRKMTYRSDSEMYAVIGHPEENSFIIQCQDSLKSKLQTVKRAMKIAD